MSPVQKCHTVTLGCFIFVAGHLLHFLCPLCELVQIRYLIDLSHAIVTCLFAVSGMCAHKMLWILYYCSCNTVRYIGYTSSIAVIYRYSFVIIDWLSVLCSAILVSGWSCFCLIFQIWYQYVRLRYLPLLFVIPLFVR